MSALLRRCAGRPRPSVRAATAAGAFALAFTSLVTVGAGSAAADETSDTKRVIDLTGVESGDDLRAAGWTHSPRPSEPVDWDITDGALRLSNAVVSSNLDFLITPRLAEKAGEPVTGAEFNTFEASFQVAAVDGEYQEGLRTEISVNDDDIARSGGTIVLHHKDGSLQIGGIWSQLGEGTDELEDWYSTVLAAVDPTVAHEVRLVFRAIVNGQDTLDVYVDDVFAGTMGTYEEYHLLNEAHERKVVSSLMFRASQSIPSETGRGWDEQPAVPGTMGKGFLFDEISYEVKNTDPDAAGERIDVDLGGPGYLSTLAGAPGGQRGWYRGYAGLDNGIVDGKLRISNATTNANQTQLVAPLLGAVAGHPEEDAEYTGFEASFRVAAVDDEFQPGLRLEIAPDDGAGSRTGGSFILHHNPASGKLEIGALWTDLSQPLGEDASTWISKVLASVDPTVAHTVRLVHNFVANGQDAVDVYVDGAYVGTTGTYEEYHRAMGNDPRTIRTVLFKASTAVPSASGSGWDTQPAVPGLAGKGFLLDQLSYGVFEAAAPTAPRDVTATLDGIDSVTATWQAPADAGTGELLGYSVRLESDTGATRTVPVGPAVTSHTFSHLAPGSYTVSVSALSSVGSTRSAAVVVVVDSLDVPAAPAAPTVESVGTDGVGVRWAAPADGGSALTGYVVRLESSSGSFRTASVDAATLSHTFTGLPAGVYTASVVAKNAVGESAVSASSAEITVRSTVTVLRPFFSKSSQIFGSKDRATVSAIVIGAEGAAVDFYDGTTKLGTATVKDAVATLTLARTLQVGTYTSVAAAFAGDDERLPATSTTAPSFRVVRTAPVSKIRVTGTSFRKSTRPKVTIRVGRFDNGRWATGKLRIRVDGKIVRTVTLKAKHKGKVTVRLPRSAKAVKVRAGFAKSPTVKKSWSRTTRISVR